MWFWWYPRDAQFISIWGVPVSVVVSPYQNCDNHSIRGVKGSISIRFDIGIPISIWGFTNPYIKMAIPISVWGFDCRRLPISKWWSPYWYGDAQIPISIWKSSFWYGDPNTRLPILKWWSPHCYGDAQNPVLVWESLFTLSVVVVVVVRCCIVSHLPPPSSSPKDASKAATRWQCCFPLSSSPFSLHALFDCCVVHWRCCPSSPAVVCRPLSHGLPFVPPSPLCWSRHHTVRQPSTSVFNFKATSSPPLSYGWLLCRWIVVDVITIVFICCQCPFINKKMIPRGLQPCGMETRHQQSSDASTMTLLNVTVGRGCSLWREGAATVASRTTIQNCWFVWCWCTCICSRKRAPPTWLEVDNVTGRSWERDRNPWLAGFVLTHCVGSLPLITAKICHCSIFFDLRGWFCKATEDRAPSFLSDTVALMSDASVRLHH